MTRPLRAALLFAACLVASIPAFAAAEEAVSVDYVIGMLQAGLDQDAIIRQVVDRQVRFVLAEGDLDRLREAGAREGLVAVVRRSAADATGDSWSRPQRLAPADRGGEREGGSPEVGEEGEPDGAREPIPYGGYAYYVPYDSPYLFYAWYGWPAYYPFALYGSYGYFGHYYPRHYSYGGRHSHLRHRGHVRGPRGAQISPRSAPRHGSGSPARSAPRGSSRSPRGRR